MVEVEPVTVDRYGRTVAFVSVGDTVVNEELIGQGLARCVHPLLRPADLPGMEGAGGEGTKREARLVVNAGCNPTVGV